MSSPDLRYTQALWYAWGHLDGGSVEGLTLDHGFQFATEQHDAQEAYNAEREHVLVSIIGAWDEFLIRKGLRKPRVAVKR